MLGLLLPMLHVNVAAMDSILNEYYRDEQCFLKLLVALISYRKEL